MTETGDLAPKRNFGPFTPLIERIFGGSRLKPSESTALASPELDEGKVPYVELFRIIREHQYDLASGLYAAYKDKFPKGFLAHADYQDYDSRLSVGGETRTQRVVIEVWITPQKIEEVQIDNWARHGMDFKYPSVSFYYNLNKETEEWYYGGGSINKTKEPGKDKPGWKWADINAEFDPSDPDDAWTRDGAVRISDLERTFGKFLHKSLAAPKPEE